MDWIEEQQLRKGDCSMSGKYPNGGYRTVQARELSMPSSATPPTVTGQRGPGSGNSPLPLQGEILAPPKRGGDLRGKMTPGLAPASSNRFENMVKVDLRPYLDSARGGSITNQKVRSRMQGTINVEIDLNGRDYRVNGRGAMLRAAIKIARGLLRGARRLPKNLWKELILEILNQLLNGMAREYGMPEGPIIGLGTGWKLRTYGTGVAPGAYPDGSFGIRDTGGNDYLAHFGLPTVGASPRSIEQIPTAVGQYGFTGLRRDPSNFGAGPQPAYQSGLSNQVVTYGWIDTTPDLYVAGLWYIHTVISPGVHRSQHLATWCADASTPGVDPRFSFKRQMVLRTGTALTPPFPMASHREGGNRAPNEPVVPPNPVRKNDRKFYIKGVQSALNAAYFASEVGDAIDCFYKALPAHKRYGRSYSDKMKRVFEAFDQVDMSKAVQCLAFNAATDPLFGRAFQWVDKHTADATVSGFWTPAQVTYEGSGVQWMIEVL